MRVAIVGGGIAGLATAIGLQRADAEVTVFERGDGSVVGAGISLFGNALVALDSIGRGAALRELSGGPVTSFRVGQRTPDGSWLATTPTDAVGELHVVHRHDLNAMLLDGLRPGTVRYGVRASASDDGVVEVPGSDGERFDLVVAADGIRSGIRSRWDLDTGLRYSGYAAWRGVTAGPVDLGGEAGETWGRQHRFGIVPLADGRVYWFAVASMPEGTVFDAERAELLRRFAGWHHPIAEVVRATDVIVRHNIHDLAKPLRRYIRGRGALVGDAAHAMTPNLGQGGGQSLEDAATLAALLRPLAAQPNADPPEVFKALERYDALRRPRSQAIASRSRTMGAVAHTPNRLVVRVRNTLLRLVPDAILVRQLEGMLRWSPPS